MPPPVRVKLYGFLTLTRRTYLILLGLGVALAVALVVVWLVTPAVQVPQEALATSRVWFWVWTYLPWIVLAALLVSALEAYLVLRKFAREEAKQRQTPPA